MVGAPNRVGRSTAAADAHRRKAAAPRSSCTGLGDAAKTCAKIGRQAGPACCSSPGRSPGATVIRPMSRSGPLSRTAIATRRRPGRSARRTRRARRTGTAPGHHDGEQGIRGGKTRLSHANQAHDPDRTEPKATRSSANAASEANRNSPSSRRAIQDGADAHRRHRAQALRGTCRMSRAKIGSSWTYGMIRKAGIAGGSSAPWTVGSSLT